MGELLEALRASAPPVQWDTGKVVSTTEAALRDLGYETAGAVIDSYTISAPT